MDGWMDGGMSKRMDKRMGGGKDEESNG